MSKSLPLVHLSVLRPLLAGLRARGVDPEPVLDGAALTEEAISREDATVHVMVVHQFLESCAKAVEDPSFCARVAEELNPCGWPMVASALQQGGSLADFLSTYVSGANAVASSVTAYLHLRGALAEFGETRHFRPALPPAQNDGFMIGLSLAMLRRTLGRRLNPKQVTLIVCDPMVLPEDWSCFQILRGDEMGARIQFPSRWLTYDLNTEPSDRAAEPAQTFAGEDFLSGFRRLLSQSVEQGGLTADQTAALVSMTRSRLARRLAKQETTITREINAAKLSVAQGALTKSPEPIQEIAARLGYADPSNFARWFKRASGQSPSQFRLARS